MIRELEPCMKVDIGEMDRKMRELREGLGLSARRGLTGHRHDPHEEMADALRIPEMGQVGNCLGEEPGACPELRKVLAKARECGHD